MHFSTCTSASEPFRAFRFVRRRWWTVLLLLAVWGASADVRAAPQPLQSAVDCQRYSLEWLGRFIEGTSPKDEMRALWMGYGALPYREEVMGVLLAAFEVKGKQMDTAFGRPLDRPVESIGVVQQGPTQLHVLATIRRTSGFERWNFTWSRRDGVWRLWEVTRGPDPMGVEAPLEVSVDAEDRVVAAPEAGVWEATPFPTKVEEPPDLETPERRRRCAEQFVLRLSERDFRGAVAAGRPDLAEAVLAERVKAVEVWDAAKADQGKLQAGQAQFLGMHRLGPDEERYVYSLRREHVDTWADCCFRRRDGKWQYTSSAAGEQSEPFVQALMLPLPGARDHLAGSLKRVAAKQFGRRPRELTKEEAAWEADAKEALGGFAAGKDAALLRLMQRAAGDLPEEKACQDRLKAMLKADAAANRLGGPYLGTATWIARIRTGRDYIEEAFIFDRDNADSVWTIALYRPTELWRFGKIESLAGERTFSNPVAELHPVWRTGPAATLAEVEILPLPRPFDPAALPPEQLADLTDCRLASARLARTMSRREYEAGFTDFLGKYARGYLQKASEGERIGKMASSAIEQEKTLGNALAGQYEYLGRIHETPSRVSFCYFLKHGGDMLSLCISFYRAEKEWIFSDFHLGLNAYRKCLRFAVVERE